MCGNARKTWRSPLLVPPFFALPRHASTARSLTRSPPFFLSSHIAATDEDGRSFVVPPLASVPSTAAGAPASAEVKAGGGWGAETQDETLRRRNPPRQNLRSPLSICSLAPPALSISLSLFRPGIPGNPGPPQAHGRLRSPRFRPARTRRRTHVPRPPHRARVRGGGGVAVGPGRRHRGGHGRLRLWRGLGHRRPERRQVPAGGGRHPRLGRRLLAPARRLCRHVGRVWRGRGRARLLCLPPGRRVGHRRDQDLPERHPHPGPADGEEEREKRRERRRE